MSHMDEVHGYDIYEEDPKVAYDSIVRNEGYDDAVTDIYNFLMSESTKGTSDFEFKVRALANKIRNGEF